MITHPPAWLIERPVSRVKGVAIDDYEIKSVAVNGREARPVRPNYRRVGDRADAGGAGELAFEIEGQRAEDAAGNVEKRPHTLHRASGRGSRRPSG